MPVQLSITDHFRCWSQSLVEFPGTSHSSFGPKGKEFKSDPSCYMLKAVDSISSSIVGASVWFIYTSAQKPQATYKGPTMQPHVYLYAIATDPSHDPENIAQSLMQWGLDRADSLGLEVWAYTTLPNASVYTSQDFESVEEIVTEAESVWSMRRPSIPNRGRCKAAYLDTQGFW